MIFVKTTTLYMNVGIFIRNQKIFEHMKMSNEIHENDPADFFLILYVIIY